MSRVEVLEVAFHYNITNPIRFRSTAVARQDTCDPYPMKHWQERDSFPVFPSQLTTAGLYGPAVVILVLKSNPANMKKNVQLNLLYIRTTIVVILVLLGLILNAFA